MACVLFAVTVDRAGIAADDHQLVPGLTGVKSVWCDIVLDHASAASAASAARM